VESVVDKKDKLNGNQCPMNSAIQNSKDETKQTFLASQTTRPGAMLMLVARLSFAFIAQILVAGLYLAARNDSPWHSAAAWWVVDGTLVDLGCLWILSMLIRQESLRLKDILGFQSKRIGRDVLLGLAYVVLLIPAVITGNMLTQWLYPGGSPPQITVTSSLPTRAVIYSIVIWPVVWAFTEELTYLGFIFPRLERITKRTWLAAILVILFWALQHIAMPFIPDGRYLFYRTISALPITVTITLIYILGGRKIPPLIFAHWFSDMAAMLSPVLILPH
jgi:uncharacterized protein